MELTLCEAETAVWPSAWGIGTLRESVVRFSGLFESGRVYALVSPPADGAWGVCSLLCGQTALPDSTDCGKILLDGTPASANTLRALGCTVGEPAHGWFASRRTVFTQLRHALAQSGCAMSVDELTETFSLSPASMPKGRLYRPLQQSGAERWLASLAIGYAAGKRIFSFPLLPAWFRLYLYTEPMAQALRFLRAQDCLVLIPFCDAAQAKGIADEIVPVMWGDVPRKELTD